MKVETIKLLNEITGQMLATLFSQDFVPIEDSIVESVPTFDVQYMIQIGLRNKKYQCVIILGFPEKAAETVLEEVFSLVSTDDEKIELAKSALGELANTIACDMAPTEDLESNFGKLMPTPPLVWVIKDKKIPDFFPAEGRTSRLEKNGLSIFTHFSAMKVANLKDSDPQNWNPTQSLSIYDPSSSK